MFGNLSGPTLLVILFIILLLFGAPKLPALARSLGQSARILKKEVSGDEDKKAAEAPAQAADTPPAAAPAAPAASAAPAAPAEQAADPATAPAPAADPEKPAS